VTDGIRNALRGMESGCKNENLNVLKIILIHTCESVVSVDVGLH